MAHDVRVHVGNFGGVQKGSVAMMLPLHGRLEASNWLCCLCRSMGLLNFFFRIQIGARVELDNWVRFGIF